MNHFARVTGLVVALAAVLSAVGCKQGPVMRPADHVAHLAPTQRNAIFPDVSALVGRPDLFEPSRTTPDYRRLTEFECQCHAVKAASIANMLELQGANAASCTDKSSLSRCKSTDVVYRQVMCYSADEIRNRSAGLALELFYRIADLEGKSDILSSSRVELESALVEVEKLKTQGFATDADVATLRKQQADLQSKAVLVEAGLDQANSQLRTLLGVPAHEGPFRISPSDPMFVNPSMTPESEAVATGLANRPDLNVLRLLASQSGRDGAAVAKQILGVVSPLLAGPPKNSCTMCGWWRQYAACLSRAGADEARAQVRALYEARERQAANEIREAIRDLDSKIRLAALAHDKHEATIKKVADLTKKSTAGISVKIDLRKAKVEELESQSDLLGAVANYQISRVKLKQAQGVFVFECTRCR